jgi:hypothetical protein
MRCGSAYSDRKPRGCRLPLNHDGRCNAMLGIPLKGTPLRERDDGIDDLSEERIEYMERRDSELRREEET